MLVQLLEVHHPELQNILKIPRVKAHMIIMVAVLLLKTMEVFAQLNEHCKLECSV